MLLVHAIGSHHMEGYLSLDFCVASVCVHHGQRAITGILYLVKVQLCLVLILERTL